MSGLFITPLGCTWVTNGMARGLTGAWLALARDGRHLARTDREFTTFLERGAVLAQSPGLGGFDVTEPPLDVESRRQALALLNGELARRLTEPDFDGSLIDSSWQALEQYWRCWWFEAVESIHRGLYASFGQPPPALEWMHTPEQRAAIDVFHAMSRLSTAPRPSEAEELAILNVVTEGVVRAGRIFRPTFWQAVERHFYRKAELEEATGRLEEAAGSWRALSTLLPDPVEQDLARRIALELDRKRSH